MDPLNRQWSYRGFRKKLAASLGKDEADRIWADAGYGHLYPKLFWGRSKTIGRGGDCCDFLPEYREN